MNINSNEKHDAIKEYVVSALATIAVLTVPVLAFMAAF